MNGFNNLDAETLLQYAALSGAGDQAGEFSSDYDDEDAYAREAWDDDEDDDEEGFYESSYYGEELDDDDDDDFESIEADDSERRRRRGRKAFWKSRRTTKLRKVRGRKTTVLRGANGQAMQVKFGGKGFVTPQQFNKAVANTEKKFRQQQKIAKGNFDKLAAEVARNSRKMKKMQESAQTTQLMSMMNQGPNIESMKVDGAKKAITDIKLGSSTNDMLLPLLMSGGIGGSGNGNSDMMMMMMLMNSQKSG